MRQTRYLVHVCHLFRWGTCAPVPMAPHDMYEVLEYDSLNSIENVAVGPLPTFCFRWAVAHLLCSLALCSLADRCTSGN